jgi:hypothetical protein
MVAEALAYNTSFRLVSFELKSPVPAMSLNSTLNINPKSNRKKSEQTFPLRI